MVLASYNANAITNGVTSPKSHVAPHFNCLDVRNAMLPLTTLLTSFGANTGANGVSAQKAIWHLILIITDLRNAVVPLMTPLHHVMLMPTLMASYDQRSNVAPHFSCLNLRNAMVLLMMLALCDTGASANGIKWPKSHVSPHFNCLYLRNSLVPFLVPLPPCVLLYVIRTFIST